MSDFATGGASDQRERTWPDPCGGLSLFLRIKRLQVRILPSAHTLTCGFVLRTGPLRRLGAAHGAVGRPVALNAIGARRAHQTDASHQPPRRLLLNNGCRPGLDQWGSGRCAYAESFALDERELLGAESVAVI
jgi:hypothetical protein